MNGSASAAVVARYFACLKAKDINALMALYAKDASFVLPVGSVCEGIDEIRAMHEEAFRVGWPTPVPRNAIIDAAGIAVECEAALPNEAVRYTANFFHFGDQCLIEQVRVYRRD